MEEDFCEQRGVPAGMSAEISSAEPVDEIHSRPEHIALRRADALVRMAQGYSVTKAPAAEIASRCMCTLTWKRSEPTGSMARPK